MLCAPVLGNSTVWFNPIWGNAQTDQERCEAEAQYMAAHSFRGHAGPTIGSFEGVGWGHHPNPATCTPARSMQLTGDATAQAASGEWFRVRSWR
ncbi:MAG: hypothetical protein KDA96_24345 [Planctomycetaceae bacterium]|nr:hypothetical protein [Planctomycetaceae bacterium]